MVVVVLVLEFFDREVRGIDAFNRWAPFQLSIMRTSSISTKWIPWIPKTQRLAFHLLALALALTLALALNPSAKCAILLSVRASPIGERI